MSEVTSNGAQTCPASFTEPSQNTVKLTLNTTKKNELKNNLQSFHSGWFSTRHYVTMMLFFGLANFFVVRAYISSALEAMLNRTAVIYQPTADKCLRSFNSGIIQIFKPQDSLLPQGKFIWDMYTQDCIVYIFYVGSLLFHIPSSFLSRRYGSAKLIGCGSLIGSILGLIIPIAMEIGGVSALYVIRLFQGIVMSPVFPCTIDLLSKWIPPNERSRCVAFVNSSAQFGMLICNQISGCLSYSSLGWPGICYFFGSVASLWSVLFLANVYEDPDSNPKMNPVERKMINRKIRGNIASRESASNIDKTKIFSIPYEDIFTSLTFYATLVAHISCLAGYFTISRMLPVYLVNVNFDHREVNTISCIPLFLMWIMVISAGWTDDYYFSKGFTRTRIRKLAIALGSFGPGICLFLSAYSICLIGFNTVMLTISFSLTGVIYTSATVNHLEIAPKYSGFLISVTYSFGIFISIMSTYFWGNVIKLLQTQQGWRTTFLSLSTVYIAAGILFTVFGSGELQNWGNEIEKDPRIHETNRTETVS